MSAGYLMTAYRVQITWRQIQYTDSVATAKLKEQRRSITKYVSDIGLEKLSTITENSCHKLVLQTSFEYCACRTQFIRVFCRRYPVTVLRIKKYLTHTRR